MFRTTLTNAILTATFLVLTACGGGGGGGGPAPSNDPIASLHITSNDLEGDTLYLTKGVGVFVGVEGRDASGDVVDERSVEDSRWSTEDGKILRVHSLDGSAVVEGRKDWFDTVPEPPEDGETTEEEPYVPVTTLTVKVDDVSDTVDVRVILSAAGSWLVTLGDGTSLPLDLSQNGRTVTHEATGAAGTVEGGSFSIDFAGYGLVGNFTDRDRVEGTLTDPSGKPGTWSAIRTD